MRNDDKAAYSTCDVIDESMAEAVPEQDLSLTANEQSARGNGTTSPITIIAPISLGQRLLYTCVHAPS